MPIPDVIKWESQCFAFHDDVIWLIACYLIIVRVKGQVDDATRLRSADDDVKIVHVQLKQELFIESSECMYMYVTTFSEAHMMTAEKLLVWRFLPSCD